jgi:hypothetical protein
MPQDVAFAALIIAFDEASYFRSDFSLSMEA